MGKSSTGSAAPSTSVRKLRTFLDDVMSQAADAASRPAICQRIRDKRKELQRQWKDEHPGEKGNPFTQERVAARLADFGVTPKTYGEYERFKEPSIQRLREIATALSLDEDYFAPTGDLATAAARLEAEGDRLQLIGDQLGDLVGELRVRLGLEEDAPPAGEPV